MGGWPGGKNQKLKKKFKIFMILDEWDMRRKRRDYTAENRY